MSTLASHLLGISVIPTLMMELTLDKSDIIVLIIRPH